DWGNSGRTRAPRVSDRPAAAVLAEVFSGPGSPCDGRLPDRTSAAAAARRHRKRGSRRKLRDVVAAVGTRPHVEHAGDRAEIERAIEMRKQLVVAGALPAQRVAERVRVDLDQEQPGLADEMLFGGLRHLRGRREMNKAVARIVGAAAIHALSLGL